MLGGGKRKKKGKPCPIDFAVKLYTIIEKTGDPFVVLKRTGSI